MLRRFPAPSTEGAAFALTGRKCGEAAPATGERRTARRRERVNKIAQAKTTTGRPRRREGKAFPPSQDKRRSAFLMLCRFPAPSTEGAFFCSRRAKKGGAAPATGERRTARRRERVNNAQAKATTERPRRHGREKLFCPRRISGVPSF